MIDNTSWEDIVDMKIESLLKLIKETFNQEPEITMMYILRKCQPKT